MRVKVHAIRGMLVLGLLFVACAFVFGHAAYQTQWPDEISQTERSLIEKEKDEKGKIKVYLKVSDDRLISARQAVNQREFQKAIGDLRAYTALVSHASQFVHSSSIKDGKKPRLFKMLEQKLLQQMPLLEGLEKDVPQDQAEIVRNAVAKARDVRAQSLNSMFGDKKAASRKP